MKKLGIKIVVFISILLLLCLFLDKLYQKLIPKTIAEKAYWIMDLKQKKYDYIVLGSSRAESSFDCVLFDSILKTHGVNLAINGAGLVENEMILKQFLQKHDIQTLFLELDEANLSPSNHLSYPFHDYVYFPYLNDPILDTFIKKNEKRNHYYFWKYIPFFKYAEFNSKFSIEKLIKKERMDTMIDVKGFRPFYNHHDEYTFIDWEGHFTDKRYWYVADYSVPKKSYEEIDAKAVKSIYNIIELCHKKHIRLVFYCAPSFVSHFTKYRYNALHKFEYLNKLAVSNQLPFINFAYWKYNQVDSLYYDYSHPNTNGAKLMTYVFSKYYNNNYKTDSIIGFYFQDTLDYKTK